MQRENEIIAITTLRMESPNCTLREDTKDGVFSSIVCVLKEVLGFNLTFNAT